MVPSKASGTNHHGGDGPREPDQLGSAIGSSATPDTARNQQARPAYVLTLVPAPGTNGPRALRRALKYIGRYCGLKATSVEQVRQ